MRVSVGVSVAATVLLLGTAACSSSDTDSAPTESNGAFPAQITDKFGTVTVDAAPERLVTAGYNDQDFALSLGVTPVATRGFSGYDYATRPWAQDQLAGNTITEVGSDTLDVEGVAAAEPDLIMATYAYLEEPEYQQLGRIATTVGDIAGSDGSETPSWRDQLAAYGTALGKTAEADTVRTEVNAKFSDATAQNPSFEGRTAAVALYLDGTFYILDSGDPRNRFFTDLGFTTPETTGLVSAERYDLLDQQTLVLLGVTPEDVAGNALLQSLNVVKDDRTVYVGEFGTPVPAALGFASPLSLPYAVDALVPVLARASDDDPATRVGTVEG
ncbi:ABC transporter substrate-binding protein [Rhodococcus sp. BP-349]|uniref:ABC transporter substrate-binding protein n=1 Tax=unclassified Rhodococcus (in: high G+C Gram-positive bacteria) TaxID=192944 RepID=UPI001C9B1858|nr:MULTISPECIES: ABC transporter substrate-binding protein [unclassified Rhodococcus (in: high G+C Gram-positive bacteria)]MBY6541316.1 ABC transporter substrate-binding protein [Rhodococcus sp. BP-363]MBY6544658.1 ABC transporter substrate-binding protein [Rhodococcus sp. BP-369]MBY6563888.1 ABC transporter substrate-binding protein [Rhodococcus sp. BP-370]MBY6579175.1 ABC transporter substrate-binding protein [Rhodococcus sp. BP-364]MBY6588476.1 ABC transporter substrate-binding protein [Rho